MWNKRKLIAVFIVVIIAVVAGFSVVQASVDDCTAHPGRGATGVSIYTNVTASSCGWTVGDIELYEEGGTTTFPLAITGLSLGPEVEGAFDTDTFIPDDPLKTNTTYVVQVYQDYGQTEQEMEISPMQNGEPPYNDEWEFTTGGPVGGLTYPNRTARLLAPWMALAALGFSLLGGGLALRKRMS